MAVAISTADNDAAFVFHQDGGFILGVVVCFGNNVHAWQEVLLPAAKTASTRKQQQH